MDWNKRYENEDTPWDKGAPAPILRELLDEAMFTGGEVEGKTRPKTSHEILVPGCGYGHDVREIAAAGYSATGIDISAKALAVAEEQTTSLSPDHQGRMTFAQEDLFGPELPRKKRYDAIWEHTCYCAISPELRSAYVEAAYHLLKPRGLLIGVFFTTEQTRPGPPHMTNRADLCQLFSARFELLWEKAPQLSYPAREGKEWLMGWRRRE